MHDKLDVKALWEQVKRKKAHTDHHGLKRVVQRGVTRGSGKGETDI